MAIRVNVYKEITEYEEKIIFGLSKRKLICSIIAGLLSISTFFVSTKILGISIDATSYVIILESIPIMAFGFYKKNGLPFEKYAFLFMRNMFGTTKLAYKTELMIDKFEIHKEGEFENVLEEKNNIKKNRRKRRKSKIKEYSQ